MRQPEDQATLELELAPCGRSRAGRAVSSLGAHVLECERLAAACLDGDPWRERFLQIANRDANKARRLAAKLIGAGCNDAGKRKRKAG